MTDASLLYGSVTNPIDFGSNGFGASSGSGEGGGYVKLVVSGNILIGKNRPQNIYIYNLS